MMEDGGYITTTYLVAKGAASKGDMTIEGGGGDLHLAPGEPWRRMEVNAGSMQLGDVLGRGS